MSRTMYNAVKKYFEIAFQENQELKFEEDTHRLSIMLKNYITEHNKKLLPLDKIELKTTLFIIESYDRLNSKSKT